MISKNLLAAVSSLHRHPRICRLITTSSPSSKSPPHNQDSYNKESDSTPPPDATIHRVDPSSESAQKPHEPPSGEWSRAGTKTSEYQSVSKTEPYGAPGQEQRYGGKESYAKEKGPETSQPGDGPEGKESGGRKPEGW